MDQPWSMWVSVAPPVIPQRDVEDGLYLEPVRGPLADPPRMGYPAMDAPEEPVVSFWQEPELPPVERMPKKRDDDSPRIGGRLLGGFAGLVLLASGGIGLWQSLAEETGQGSPIGALAVLLPAGILLRYAATGQIKP